MEPSRCLSISTRAQGHRNSPYNCSLLLICYKCAQAGWGFLSEVEGTQRGIDPIGSVVIVTPVVTSVRERDSLPRTRVERKEAHNIGLSRADGFDLGDPYQTAPSRVEFGCALWSIPMLPGPRFGDLLKLLVDHGPLPWECRH